MTRSTFLRARRPEHKQQRREAILAVAGDLAATSGVGNVSLTAVADAVGLAKSNISRYFETREAIYLELLAEEWNRYADDVTQRLHSVTGTVPTITVLAETFAHRPLFCDLLSHLPTSLEYNVSAAVALSFKQRAHTSIAAVARAIADATPLTEEEGSELIAAASGLAGLLYRADNPPPVLAQVYAEAPDLTVNRRSLLPTLTRMLSALAEGLPTLRDR